MNTTMTFTHKCVRSPIEHCSCLIPGHWHLGFDMPPVTTIFCVKYFILPECFLKGSKSMQNLVVIEPRKLKCPCDWELLWHVSLWRASDKRFWYVETDLLRCELYNNKYASCKATVSSPGAAKAKSHPSGTLFLSRTCMKPNT